MVWAKIDDAILDNAKIAKVGVLGFALHIAAITWCCRNLTDGFIPSGRVSCLLNFGNTSGEVTAKLRSNCNAVPASVDRLCDAWMDCGEVDAFSVVDDLVEAALWKAVDGGYALNDFLVYNPSKKQVLEERERGRARAKASGAKRKASPEAAPKLHRNFAGTSDGPVPVPGIDLKPSSVPLEVRSPKGSPKVGSRITESYKPTEATIKQCRLLGHSSPEELVPEFIDYWIAKTGKDASKLNWESTFRNWVRTDLKRGYRGKVQLQQTGFSAHTQLAITAAMEASNDF